MNLKSAFLEVLFLFIVLGGVAVSVHVVEYLLYLLFSSLLGIEIEFSGSIQFPKKSLETVKDLEEAKSTEAVNAMEETEIISDKKKKK